MSDLYSETVLRLKESNGGKELVTISKASIILGIDKRTIISHRLVPLKKIGSRLYIAVNDLAAFLADSVK